MASVEIRPLSTRMASMAFTRAAISSFDRGNVLDGIVGGHRGGLVSVCGEGTSRWVDRMTWSGR